MEKWTHKSGDALQLKVRLEDGPETNSNSCDWRQQLKTCLEITKVT